MDNTAELADVLKEHRATARSLKNGRRPLKCSCGEFESVNRSEREVREHISQMILECLGLE